MSKNSLLMIVLFVRPMFVSCEKEINSSIVGEWYNYSDYRSSFYEETFTINIDGTFVCLKTRYGLNGSEKYMASQTVSEGTLKFKKNRLWIKVSRAQYRLAVGSVPGTVKLTDWEYERNYSRETKNAEISFFQNNSALLVNKLYDPHYDKEYLKLYIRKGTTLTNNLDLQGTWYSFRKLPVDPDNFNVDHTLFDAVDIAINIRNDSIDLIFNSDGARYVGKYKYENGVLSTVGELTCYTSWVSGNNMANWTDPYAAPWRESNNSDPSTVNHFYEGFSFTFIAEGETAYFNIGDATQFKKQ